MHWLTIAEIIGGLLVLLIAGWIWWRLPQRQVARLTGLTEAKDRGELENNFRQTITHTVGGLVVIFGAAFAYVQFQEQRHDFAVQQQASDHAHRRAQRPSYRRRLPPRQYRGNYSPATARVLLFAIPVRLRD